MAILFVAEEAFVRTWERMGPVELDRQDWRSGGLSTLCDVLAITGNATYVTETIGHVLAEDLHSF